MQLNPYVCPYCEDELDPEELFDNIEDGTQSRTAQCPTCHCKFKVMRECQFEYSVDKLAGEQESYERWLEIKDAPPDVDGQGALFDKESFRLD